MMNDINKNANRIKHLEFIESNISRMNTCCFQMKGWSVTLATALIAVYASSIDDTGKGNALFILAAIFPTVLFWALDSYYLHKERKFMYLYKQVAGIEKKERVDEFSLSIKTNLWGFLGSVFISVNCIFYLFMCVGLLVLYFILR